jgi:hypothetical protein
MVKGADKFAVRHTSSQEVFDEFIRECTEFQCPRPSSYSSVFHSVFRTARIPASINAQFSHSFAGGWEQAKMTGVLPGRWLKYDLNSAYLWASTLGLPRPSTFKFARRLAVRPGLYHVELATNLEHLPYPYNARRFVNATDDEINLYGLPIHRIISGVTWEDYLPEDVVTNVIKQFSFGKEVSKAYWGRWCSSDTIRCTCGDKVWELPNPTQNLVWAHLLIGRVKARVWQESKNAAHIFVDSIITRDEIRTADGLGSWRLDAEYANGVKVQHAGFYGPADSSKWDRTSGRKKA